ncbi:alpha-amylase family glycosyl hydrolase [Agriterribacter sp.]|uniref:alpha-amylase family glycosyl hydrolase n=1 Tax=Agriterribacter sp. TaxID=2821509 RepID=UPI002C911049|nr:alpha-amylase family glycosyl hydrolase [Agriterribacter sp.]HRP56151.1 alpha-amylase family glycosyl hydrolase [Agriterribacter sp.]
MHLKKSYTGNSSSAEIIYHVFQRSFFDSNNDKHGDLNGLKQKLGYLQDLGVTSILLTPLYRSAYYHNYFADDFESIDPAYGTAGSYFSLVREAHQRGMKIYMDMEIQYITEDHAWYKDAYENPHSPFSEYLLYKDEENKIPETIIFDISGLHGYDAVYRNITTVNLHNKEVQDYMYRLFSYWADPGNATDGVDGFRLDHMMDTLDNKKRLSNLFETFWKPLIGKLKELRPELVFIAEQTDWDSFGDDHIKESGADRVFAFPLREAMLTFNKDEIDRVAAITFNMAPDPNQNIVFIENHDTQRFATQVLGDEYKLRTGAALNLLLAGTPAVYYGQELGMTGDGGFGKYGISDGNDIPRREAFKWYKDIYRQGMALWYKDTGPWWQDSYLVRDDGISLEEQKNDRNSLWNFYKQLIALRKSNAAIAYGKYKTLQNNSANVYSFMRYNEDQVIIIAINLTGNAEALHINAGAGKISFANKRLQHLFGEAAALVKTGNIEMSVSPYAIEVWELVN